MLSIEPWAGQAPLSPMIKDDDLNSWLWYQQICLFGVFFNARLFNGILCYVWLGLVR